MTENNSDIADTRLQFQILMGQIENYPFNSIVSKLTKKNIYLASGNPVRPKDFDENGVNLDILKQIDSKLETTDVVLLVAATRMGTTSVGKAWVSKKEADRDLLTPILLYQDDYDNLLPKNPQKEFFIDEFNPRNEPLMGLVKGLTSQKRKLVLRIFPPTLDTCKTGMEDRDIKFSQVDILPLNEDSMKEFLSKKIELDKKDPLVQVIAGLSGGSLFITSLVCNNIFSPLFIRNPNVSVSDFRKVLKESRYQGDAAMSDWNRDKSMVSPIYRKFYPSPILQGASL